MEVRFLSGRLMMTKEDIAAKCVAIAKEKVRITNHRNAKEAECKRFSEERGKLTSAIKSCQKDIDKSINMLCNLEGQQYGLLALLSDKERTEVINQLITYSVPRR